ncbi:MAG: calcium/proton exchanger, partial [Gaiellaceae bacterium]
FVLAAVALIPLAWLIGEATEHAADHTGPGIGGFLNATFGNAPELIIALIALDRGLPDVVRGSLVGSVVGNLLLVLGISLIVGKDADLDRFSTMASLGLIGAALALFIVPSVAGWHGDPNRHSLAVVAIPIAAILLGLYGVATWRSLRRHHDLHAGEDDALTGWSLPAALGALAAATVGTAFVAEVLVGSLDSFATRAGLSDFFVAAVIVAIVGNAAEHGSAVVVAHRGKVKLAVEIALSSAAQVAVFLIPAVLIASFAIHAMPLSFRPVELGALAASLVAAGLVLAAGRSSRSRGILLVVGYVTVAIAFLAAGDR